MSNSPFPIMAHKEAFANIDKIESMLSQWDCVWVVSDNKPDHVIMKFDEYERLYKAKDDLESLIEKEQLPKLLGAIGMQCFIQYFHNFWKNHTEGTSRTDFIKEDYSLASKRSRVSKAKKIFAKGWQGDAIILIMESNRVNIETKLQAKQLLDFMADTEIYN